MKEESKQVRAMAKITITKKILRARQDQDTGVIYIPAEIMKTFNLEGKMAVITIEPVEDYHKKGDDGNE